MLDKNINISANNLKALEKCNTSERVIEYYSNYDSSISATDSFAAKQKILFITDNSVLTLAQ